MAIVYINKVKFPSAMPSTVFSAANALGFARIGTPVYFIAQRYTTAKPEVSFQDHFGFLPPLLLSIRLFSNRLGFLRSNSIFYWRAFFWMLKHYRTIPIQTIITRDPAFLFYGALLKHFCGIKLYYQPHNFYHSIAHRRDLNPTNRWKHHLSERLFLCDCNAILPITPPQTSLYRQACGVPVFTSVPGLLSTYPATPYRRDAIICAYVGSLQPLKGIELIVETIAQLDASRFRLLILGGRNQTETAYATELCTRHGILERTEITGWLRYQSLHQHLGRAHVGFLLLPDNFYNRHLTAPSKLFDYLSHGIPLVASRLPAIESLVSHNQEGMLLEAPNAAHSAAAVERITATDQIYQQFQQACIQRAKSYTWERTAQTMLQVMDRT